jgi:hypothetical protein
VGSAQDRWIPQIPLLDRLLALSLLVLDDLFCIELVLLARQFFSV